VTHHSTHIKCCLDYVLLPDLHQVNSNDTKVIAASTQGNVEIWVGILVDIMDRSVGEYDLPSLS
jgi:hypothetical protein